MSGSGFRPSPNFIHMKKYQKARAYLSDSARFNTSYSRQEPKSKDESESVKRPKLVEEPKTVEIPRTIALPNPILFPMQIQLPEPIELPKAIEHSTSIDFPQPLVEVKQEPCPYSPDQDEVNTDRRSNMYLIPPPPPPEIYPPIPPYPPPVTIKEEVKDGNEVNETSPRAPNNDSNSMSATGKGTMCRDYVRGFCARGDSCSYDHNLVMPNMVDLYKFCNDFQNKGCERTTCNYLHASWAEKATFYSNGYLPEHTWAHIEKSQLLPPPPPPQGVPLYNYTEPPPQRPNMYKTTLVPPPPPPPLPQQEPTVPQTQTPILPQIYPNQAYQVWPQPVQTPQNALREQQPSFLELNHTGPKMPMPIPIPIRKKSFAELEASVSDLHQSTIKWQNPVQTSQKPIQAPQQAAPVLQQTYQSEQQSFPTFHQPYPTPVQKQSTSAHEEEPPSLEEIIPALLQLFPAIQQSLPNLQESLAALQQFLQLLEGSIPSLQSSSQGHTCTHSSESIKDPLTSQWIPGSSANFKHSPTYIGWTPHAPPPLLNSTYQQDQRALPQTSQSGSKCGNCLLNNIRSNININKLMTLQKEKLLLDRKIDKAMGKKQAICSFMANIIQANKLDLLEAVNESRSCDLMQILFALFDIGMNV